MGIFTKFWGESKPNTTETTLTTDEAFESFLRRKGEADATDESTFESYIDSLPPHKRASARAMHELANEKYRYTTRYPQPNRSKGFSYNPYKRSLDPEIAASIGAGVLAFGLWAASLAITSANYNSDDAQQYLEQQGYTNVQSEGTDVLFVGFKGCDGADNMKFSFEATGANGVDTHVMVCKGLFKAATARQG